jgi:hypothetical protein
MPTDVPTDLLLSSVSRTAIDPALAFLPRHMDSDRARVFLLATGLQESRLKERYQLGGGPARGLWQCERGSKLGKGGVWGVYLHRHSHHLLQELCKYRDCSFDPSAIHALLASDDVLAAGVARLLMWTDAQPLPAVDDEVGAWVMYAERCWRPGKPHPETWPGFHARAREFVMTQKPTGVRT